MSNLAVVDTGGRVNAGIGRHDTDIAIAVKDSRDYATALCVVDKEVDCSQGDCMVAE